MDGAAAHLGEAWLDASAIDWEDIAGFTLNGSPFLLVADTGNNALSRSFVTFLVLAEPALPQGPATANVTVTNLTTVQVRYPAHPFDIESVAVDPETDEILVVSKGVLATAPVDPSGPNQALYSVSLSRALQEKEVTLEFKTVLRGIRPGPGEDPVAEYNYGIGGGRTTAMDLHPAGTEVAILTYREILLWARGSTETWAQALEGVPRAVSVSDPGKDQMEGVSYSHDGALLLVADEQGQRNSELTIVRAAP